MWTAKAPSNIALIKYMGKQEDNIPCNISLSYTLDDFSTEVWLDLNEKSDKFINNTLSKNEKNRFLNHLSYIKNLLNFDGFFSVRSANSFPKSAGIASSASSFAALTTCAFKAISDVKNSEMPSSEYMSKVSRVGSGSSCRSFFSPWCIWEGESAKKIDLPIKIEHELILINSGKKEISSSEAHRRVQSSSLMQGRAQRAKSRCEKLISAFENGKWSEAYQICWEEFQDMHALFETSCPHFGYILPETLDTLIKIRKFWKNHNDGPIVTLDAGPNIHLLWKKGDKQLRKLFDEEYDFQKFPFHGLDCNFSTPNL